MFAFQIYGVMALTADLLRLKHDLILTSAPNIDSDQNQFRRKRGVIGEFDLISPV